MKQFLFTFMLTVLVVVSYAQNSDLNSQLFDAVQDNDSLKVKQLIEQGADVNAKNKIHYYFSYLLYYDYNYTSLHYACWKGYANIAKLLIDKGADVNAKSEHGNTPLHMACKEGSLEIVKLLIDNGADVNAKNEEEQTPIFFSLDYEDMSKYLVEKGADIKARDIYGQTLLHFFMRSDVMRINVLQFLLEQGLDPNATTYYGLTPLHYAIITMLEGESTMIYGGLSSREARQIISLLIKYSADQNIKDKGGRIPADYLFIQPDDGLISILNALGEAYK